MQRRIAVTLLSGVLAGFLPLLPGAGPLFGLVMTFIPLLLLGLAEGAKYAVHGGIIAIIIALRMGGDQSALNMTLAVMSCCVLMNHLLSFRVDESGKVQWYPAIRSLSELTLFTAALVTLLMLASFDPTTKAIRPPFSFDPQAYSPQEAEMLQTVFTEWGFLIIGLLWVMLIWCFTLVANRVLAARGWALRPKIALTARGIPSWLPFTVLFCAVFAVAGQGSDSFIARTIALLLLLPHFLSGMVMIHTMSHGWKPRVFWLSMIYIVLIFLSWTTIFVALAGLYFHLSEMLDKRRKIG